MRTIEKIRSLRRWAKGANLQGEPHYLRLMAALLIELESLPINWDTPVRHPAGFILIGDEWFPVHVMNELPGGWSEWNCHDPNGVSSGISQPGHWAHCTADNTPSLPDEAFPERELLEAEQCDQN